MTVLTMMIHDDDVVALLTPIVAAPCVATLVSVSYTHLTLPTILLV